MAIPKLEVPTYELTQPSTGKKIRYRPFLVKEHKALLMMTGSSDSEIARVIEEIVDVCTFNKLNVKQLPNFDLEYIFTQLRARAIGEKLGLVITCSSCETKFDYSVNLNDLQVEKDSEHQSKFLITDTVGVEMKYPRFQNVANIFATMTADEVYETVLSCIKATWTKDGDYYEVTDDDREDLEEFINSMTLDQFAKIEKFFETMPKLTHKISAVCPSCVATNRTKLEGLINFFV
jgi:hypothetical protein